MLILVLLVARKKSANRKMPGNQLRENMEKMRKEAPFKNDRK